MSVTKNNKKEAPIRRRKQLVARRWCFMALMMLVVLFFVIWSNAHWGLLWQIVSWLVLGVYLIPIIQVVYCKYFRPVVTPLMVRRYFQQRKYGKESVCFEWKWVPLSDIAPVMANAANVAEDIGMFLYSRGFLFNALRKAYNHNQKSTELRGGSTISQQTAKNCFLPHSRTLLRKLVEAYYVVLIELIWGKKRIMECYLNIVEFGRGIYGCEAASQHYFHHAAATLTAHEAALLAATLPWPLRANPDSRAPFFDKRVMLVEKRLQSYEAIKWDVTYEELDLQKLEECNRGLLFFVKWLCVQYYRKLFKKVE